MPQVSTALQFSRNYALPLDAMSVFANTAALEEAKSSPIAYAGMVATISGVEGDGKVWVLDSTKSNWLSVSGSSTGSNSTTILGTITTGTWNGATIGLIYGGTGATDATTARTNLGVRIGTDVQSYSAVLGSVANATYTGSTSTITVGTISSGTWTGANIAVANGGTGANEATTARTNLGVRIGTDVQAYSAVLGSVSNATYTGSANTTTLGTITTGTWNAATIGIGYGGTGGTDVATARTNLGVAIGTNVQAYSAVLGSVSNATYTGSANTTTLGTITTGTWNAATISLSYGGTGATDATAARTNLGVRIGTDVQAYSATLGSVANATYTGSTSTTTLGIISTGTWNGGVIAVQRGGTGAINDAAARTSLGVAIGTNVQAYSAVLGSVALATYTGSSNTTTVGAITVGTWAGAAISVAKGGTGGTDAATARTSLGVAIGTNVQAYSANLAAIVLGTYTGSVNTTTLGTITTGTWNGTTIAVLRGGTGAADATTARTSLGVAIGTNVQAYSAVLGSVALATYTGSTNTTILGTISTGTWNAASISILKGGTGGTDAATARTSLGVAIGTNVQAYSAVLGSVALATYTGSTNTTTVGTIVNGTWAGANIAVAYGGTGATDATTARTNLGVRIGTDIQAYSATLGSVANGTYAGSANTTILGTIATGTWNAASISILKGGTGGTDAATARTSLGVAIGTNVQAYSAVLGSVALATYTGSTSTTTLGTINSGVWAGSNIAVAYGGTGATDATTARTNLGVRIGTDVQTYSAVLGSVANASYTGSTSTTTLGTISSGTWTGANIAVANGGTGANEATTARTNLGVRIGTDVQAYNAVLGSVANASYTGSTSTTTLGTISSGTWNGATIGIGYGGTGGTDASTARTSLGVSIGTSVQAYSAVLGSVALATYTGSANTTILGSIATGTWNGATIGIGYGGTGATDATAARTNLGVRIGTDVQAYSSALANLASGGSYVGSSNITTLGTITTGTWNGATIAVANGGTGATEASSARTNLGLGTLSTQNSNSVTITGGNIDGTQVGYTTSNPGYFSSLTVDQINLDSNKIISYGNNDIILEPNGTGNVVIGGSGVLELTKIYSLNRVSFGSMTTDRVWLTGPGGSDRLSLEKNIISSTDSTLHIRSNYTSRRSQKSIFILKATTTGITSTELTTDGNSRDANNILKMDYTGNWNFDARISAYSNTTNEGAGWNFRGVLKKTSSGYSLMPSMISENWTEDSLADSTVDISVSNSQIQILVTGVASNNIQWTCVFEASAYESDS